MVSGVVNWVTRECTCLRHAAELPERKRIGGGNGHGSRYRSRSRGRSRSSNSGSGSGSGRRDNRLRTGRIRKGMAIAIRIRHVFESVIIAARSMNTSSE